MVENLRYIISNTGARIVLSSDWRRTKEARDEVKRILAHYGMEFISCTPQHGSPYSLNRATEVLSWVEDHNRRCREEHRDESEMVEAFVAIDDRPLIHEVEGRGMVGHFVMTHIRRGLTRPACEVAIKCLETPQDIPKILLNPDVKAAVRAGRLPPRAQLVNSGSGFAAVNGAAATANNSNDNNVNGYATSTALSGNGHGGASAAVAHAVNSSRESSRAAGAGQVGGYERGGGGGGGGAMTSGKNSRQAGAAAEGAYGGGAASGSSKPSTPTSPRSPRTPNAIAIAIAGAGASPISSPSARAAAAAASRHQNSEYYDITTRGSRATMVPRTPNGKYTAGGGGGQASPASRGSPLSATHLMRDNLPSLGTQGLHTADGGSSGGLGGLGANQKSPSRGSPRGVVGAATGSRALTPSQRSVLRARTTAGSGVAPPTLAMSKTISTRGGRFSADSPPRAVR